MAWRLLGREDDESLGWGEYEIVGDEDLLAVAHSNFHEYYEVGRRVIGKKPTNLACWKVVAQAMKMRRVRDIQWFDWAWRNPMKARLVLDLSEADRSHKYYKEMALREPPESIDVEPTWYPMAYCGSGMKLHFTEFVVRACPDWQGENFGFDTDEEAASAHFELWENRRTLDGQLVVIGKRPSTHTSKVLCKVANVDRGHEIVLQSRQLEGEVAELFEKVDQLIGQAPIDAPLPESALKLRKALQDALR